ncbi:ABC transporter ATP-binding protein [Enterococcus asini]|uniref:ABC transporter ATP-binding protein n=1 Tax=Enterococcus asini TaxID=57732 RepID=UPI0023503D53|nr:ATP-binding cassette domain-containing protein [Enterococcus asini]
MQVAPGSVFALLGSNGAGKTTIINILTSLLPADGGKCTVAGFDVASEGEKVRQSISLTGQFAAVDDILTGRENLELIARLRREPEPKQVADKMLGAVSLVAAADKPVGTYSGGMRRRIDIAMSLIGAPKVIFLDEPTTGLDPEARNEVYTLIRQLVAQGTTIFLTT